MCFILHQWIWIFAPISFCDCHIFRYFHLTQTQFNTKRIGKHNWLKFLFITINCTTFWYFFSFFFLFFNFFIFSLLFQAKFTVEMRIRLIFLTCWMRPIERKKQQNVSQISFTQTYSHFTDIHSHTFRHSLAKYSIAYKHTHNSTPLQVNERWCERNNKQFVPNREVNDGTPTKHSTAQT